ncbi:MAG: sulfotransferase [Sphingomonas sp.]
MRVANAMLGKAWARGWAARPSLDPEALIRIAADRTGAVPDRDAIGWRMRLDRLCADLEQHARLTDLGRTIAHGQLVSALSGRFRAHALWRRQPDIAERPLSAPIIVVGQMRSGTTRMQRLLACDPRLTFTRFYESWNPIPAGRPYARMDARKVRGWMGLACARLLNPGFDAIHPTAWHAPDEEIGLHSLSIFGSAFEAQWRVPGFTAAVENDECTPVYREFKHLLQTLAWLRGDATDRPWVLKVPQFSQDLPALLRVFPDARLVCLHRDPPAVVASSASLVFNQMALQSHHVDPGWIGREWSRKVRLRQERTAAARATADVPQVEVRYDDVTQDWSRQIERVYAMLRLPLDDTVRTTMGGYIRASCPTRRTAHAYDPQRFGLAAPAPRAMALAD